MQGAEKLSPEQIRTLLEASQEVQFHGEEQKEMYEWITRTLHQQGYRNQGRKNRGLLRSYVAKMTGLGRTQVTRLFAKYMEHSEVKAASYTRRSFPSRFTRGDLELLASVDEAHETLSGPATKKILEREVEKYNHTEYERLASISVAHIYNLRKRQHYRHCWMNYTKTRAVQVAIGERRRPEPGGKPGYLRVDTVHQGDMEGVKGVYHINAVDEVTQWQVVGSVPAITQSYLKPVLQGILEQFPFPVKGFHSDNGSEYINDTVSGLLKKLLIEQTKSRPRHSNDKCAFNSCADGLVESKNGAVIRKHMGYGYIAAEHSGEIGKFYQSYFNPYLNFHRPCGQPELVTDSGGKQKYVYRRYATPWEVLRELTSSLPEGQSYLKPGHTIQTLDQIAAAQSDTESARRMQDAKQKLFLGFQKERRRT